MENKKFVVGQMESKTGKFVRFYGENLDASDNPNGVKGLSHLVAWNTMNDFAKCSPSINNVYLFTYWLIDQDTGEAVL